MARGARDRGPQSRARTRFLCGRRGRIEDYKRFSSCGNFLQFRPPEGIATTRLFSVERRSFSLFLLSPSFPASFSCPPSKVKQQIKGDAHPPGKEASPPAHHGSEKFASLQFLLIIHFLFLIPSLEHDSCRALSPQKPGGCPR